MSSGYKILWTKHALTELNETISYLEANWSEKEIKKLFLQLEKTLQLIAFNPFLFQESKKKSGVRRAVILKLNSLFYRVKDNKIEILSFFANRKKASKL